MNACPFGLRYRPFPATPDVGCYYPSGSHERALERLLAGLADGEGMLLLIGAPGTGKTLLCHRLLDLLGEGEGKSEGIESVCLTHTHLRDRVSLLQAILFDLALPYEGKSEQEMRLVLIDHLLRRFADGKKTVLVIDEAQHLGVDLLEEVRMLGNLEGQGGKAVQVVLAAQPDFLDTLGAPGLGSLRQRLAVRALIETLDVEEAADFLLHHLRAAGGQAERILGGEALELLARNTHGVPRLLNQVGHQAVRLASEAGSEEIDIEAALEALTLLGLPGEFRSTAEEDAGVLLVEPAAEALISVPHEDAESDSRRLFLAPGRSA